MTALKKGPDDVAIPASEVKAALELILTSGMFINAPRMCSLLRFLVGKAISGTIRDTSEYAIGIEVFARDPGAYNTSEDPIVRVQVGRLREKLKSYYTTIEACAGIEISIPLGSYMPVIRRIKVADAKPKPRDMLAIFPLKCISHHGDGVSFTQGLNEELKHQLFKTFGNIMVSPAFSRAADAGNENRALKNFSSAGVKHVLEGSVQIDAGRLRTSIRVVDVSTGCIVWSEQFDRKTVFTISDQEELAESICRSLKRFFYRE